MTPDDFCLCLQKDCALSPGAHVLAAVSGGADSTALLCFFAGVRERFPLRVSCAHVEHGIRGDASVADMGFVAALCGQLGIACHTEAVDAPAFAREHGCGMEDAARQLRYCALERIADAIGADVIALAHHAGDQAETVLMHAARGSDVHGLCAMRMRSGRLIRPLLNESPQALRAYLQSIGQGWREDESNGDEAFARNRIRRQIMPQLERVSAGAGAALCRLSAAAQRDEDYFARQLDSLNIGVMPLVDGAAVQKAQLSGLHPALLSRALVRVMARAGVEPQSAFAIHRIMEALPAQDAVVNLTGGAHAVVGRRYLCIVRPCEIAAEVPLCVPGTTDTPFGRFVVRRALPGETGDGRLSQRIPLDKLRSARVTGRREGDTLIPFGRRSGEKIKKLMIDAGVERAMRASVPVIRSDEGILFVVGLRPSELCRGKEDEEQMMVCFRGAWPGEKDR